MKKIGLTLILLVAFLFANVFQMIGAINVFAVDMVDSEPPAETAQYDEWKQNYVRDNSVESFSAWTASPASLSGNKIYNSYIELAVASNGRYTVGTTDGNPDSSTDNYKKLLFGHPNPQTSYTTLNLNGINYKYGSFSINPTFDSQANNNTSEQIIENFRVKQILSIIKNG